MWSKIRRFGLAEVARNGKYFYIPSATSPK